MKRQEYCASCRKINQFTDCEDCGYQRPKLIIENTDAWQLWTAIETQWRVDYGAVIGLDYTAVKNIAKMLDININPATLKKISKLEKMTLGHWRKKEERGGK